MTTDPDHRVACHQLAQDRRNQGKPIWDKHVRIKHLFAEDCNAEKAIEIGEKIAAILESRFTKSLDHTSENFDYELDNIIYSFGHDVNDVEDLDDVLEAFYDWADMERVWVE